MVKVLAVDRHAGILVKRRGRQFRAFEKSAEGKGCENGQDEIAEEVGDHDVITRSPMPELATDTNKPLP